MTGYLIRNTGSAVTVETPAGERIPAESVPAALDIVDAKKLEAGPMIRCPGCDPDGPEGCPCVAA